MFPKLLLLFIGLPLVELVVLVKLGEVIGFWPTIGLVVITGILGVSLARAQGFMVYTRIQTELVAGRIPTGELVDGLLILIGGIFLLTPGLLTDLFGIALLFPWIRALFKQWLLRKFSGMVQRGQTRIFYDDMDSSRRDFDSRV